MTTQLETTERLTPGAASSAITWEYSPSLESTDHFKVASRYNLFIGGKFVEPHSKKWFPTINPATEETLAEIAEADAQDVDRAVVEARRAYEKVWRKVSPSERAKYIFRIARLIQEKARALAVVETLNGGKPIKESRDIDVPLAAAHFFYYAGWADKLEYAFPNRNVSALGVAGQIIPWNFPLLMMAWKVAPALAAGCPIVIKPAEFTPLTALLFAELADAAALPPGVLNVFTGEGDTGAAIAAHEGIDKIAFTGSTEVGRIIRKATAGSGKKLSLELGGKSPFVVF
ncbi:MAG TPA: aldehyde dehydrogenase family protein, partial [Thermoanaerobaculia bacterium]